MLIWNQTHNFPYFTPKVPLDQKVLWIWHQLKFKNNGVTESAKIKISNQLGYSENQHFFKLPTQVAFEDP